jgi:imidazolonepropionase-like amidohydrolase
MRYILILFVLLLSSPAWAQVPMPAPQQQRAIVLRGGTIHVGNGTVVENGAIAFDGGRITYVGPVAGLQAPANADVVDVTGRQIYPGLIALNSALGLTEVDAVRATVDEREVGELNPNVRALIAYNTDSDIIPTIRANGVLMSQVTPTGGLIAGQSSMVHHDAWNWQDAVVRQDIGIHMDWPLIFRRTGWWAEPGPVERNKDRDKALLTLEALFSESAVYRPGANEARNLKLAAMQGLFDGSKTLFIHASNGKEIVESVKFARRHGVRRVVIMGGKDAWMVADFLRENQVPVVLSRLHDLPNRPEDDTDLPYKMPVLLRQAGVEVALSYQSNMGMRNLPFVAGTAHGYGMSYEDAVASVTSVPARIAGIDGLVGTLEPGKLANIVVSEGDLLDMRTNNVTLAFIQGRSVLLTDKQKALDEKFRAKYGIELPPAPQR